MYSLLQARNVKRHYSREFSLGPLSLTLERGTALILAGPNGSGKSCLMRILSGLVKPQSGEILIEGRYADRNVLSSSIGLVQQFKGLPGKLTVSEYLIHQARLRRGDPDTVPSVINSMGLVDYKNAHMNALSGGTLRKIHIASSMLHNPSILLMDEPTTGLDIASRRRVWNAIHQAKEMGMGVIVTTHHIDEVEAMGDTLAIMVDGEIILSGTPQSISQKVGIAPRIEAILAHGKDMPDAIAKLDASGLYSDLKQQTNVLLSASVITNTGHALAKLITTLTKSGIEIAGASVRKPNLDDILDHAHQVTQ